MVGIIGEIEGNTLRIEEDTVGDDGGDRQGNGDDSKTNCRFQNKYFKYFFKFVSRLFPHLVDDVKNFVQN